MQMETSITSRKIVLFSEGTQLAADIYAPAAEAGVSNRPAILLCHGWGGLKEQLSEYARAFASAGFVAMIFDYRGWGASDARVIALPGKAALLEAGIRTIEVRVLRDIVDPFDQIADVRACLAVLAHQADVDPEQIGIWGTSFGGGHAVYTAAHDKRIRAVVAQIGGYGLPSHYQDQALLREMEKASGLIETIVPQGGLDTPPNLKGTADLARMAHYSPLTAAMNVHVPTLIIDAEQEELFNRLENGFAAYMIVRQNARAEYRTFPCMHYGIYDQYFQQSVSMAIDWFKKSFRSENTH
jgi:dienelactone hydrolase